MSTSRTAVVAGEPVSLLIEALRVAGSGMATRDDGMMAVGFQLDRRLAPPFVRALMRVEAELLLHDADRLGQGSNHPRTDGQRRADAFVALALRVVEAAPTR